MHIRALLVVMSVAALAGLGTAQQRSRLERGWELAVETVPGERPTEGWRKVEVPGTFEDVLGAQFDGVAWYRIALASSGEAQAVRAGGKPIPPAMQQLLAPYFKRDTLSTTRWTVGTGRVDLGTIVTEQFMDEGAVALNRQIVFSSERLTENVWMWAHELAHVEQYRRMGIDRFAAAYIADWRAIEREASQRADKVTAAIRKSG